MTIVILTHRMAAIFGADAIYVVDRGCLVESGGRDVLIVRRPGRFRELCQAQAIEADPAAGSLRSLYQTPPEPGAAAGRFVVSRIPG